MLLPILDEFEGVGVGVRFPLPNDVDASKGNGGLSSTNADGEVDPISWDMVTDSDEERSWALSWCNSEFVIGKGGCGVLKLGTCERSGVSATGASAPENPGEWARRVSFRVDRTAGWRGVGPLGGTSGRSVSSVNGCADILALGGSPSVLGPEVLLWVSGSDQVNCFMGSGASFSVNSPVCSP